MHSCIYVYLSCRRTVLPHHEEALAKVWDVLLGQQVQHLIQQDDDPARRAQDAPQMAVVPLHAVADVVAQQAPPLPLRRADVEVSVAEVQHTAQDHEGLQRRIGVGVDATGRRGHEGRQEDQKKAAAPQEDKHRVIVYGVSLQAMAIARKGYSLSCIWQQMSYAAMKHKCR